MDDSDFEVEKAIDRRDEEIREVAFRRKNRNLDWLNGFEAGQAAHDDKVCNDFAEAKYKQGFAAGQKAEHDESYEGTPFCTKHNDFFVTECPKCARAAALAEVEKIRKSIDFSGDEFDEIDGWRKFNKELEKLMGVSNG